jgi:hypothetical protein
MQVYSCGKILHCMKQIYIYFLILSGLLFFPYTAHTQAVTQVIRGRIIDKDSKIGLPGAAIILLDNAPDLKGTTTDTEGYFKLANVALGKHTVKVSYIGYQELIIPNIVVNAGKEAVLALELETSIININEVVVSANTKEGTVNEMASVSSPHFCAGETERYAGSRQDPARMASNFAGVQGSDDSRNDIVVRGNSPAGVLYRLEDVNIPNPNHFAIAGTTGGPVSILNNKVLGTSDFMTGAFPAGYGNALAGVFDLKMRNGNNTTHEFTGQFGILGTELAAEGPISRDRRSSYLATYRYSTLRVFQALGINIGTTGCAQLSGCFLQIQLPGRKKKQLAICVWHRWH